MSYFQCFLSTSPGRFPKDGGILALDAFSLGPGTVPGGGLSDAPVAVLIPGLGGTANGGYVRKGCNGCKG